MDSLKDIDSEDAAIAICKKAFRIAHRISPILSKDGGIFITVQNTNGDFGLSGATTPNVFLGGIPGLVKTAALEWPKASVKSIDVNKSNKTDEEIADLLFKELTEGGPEIEIGLIDSEKRITLKNEEALAGEKRYYIDEKSVIIVSGGARGVTAISTIELAKRFRPKIVLFGRTKIVEEPDYLKGIEGDAAIKKALLENAKQKGEVILPAKLGEETSKILAQREIKDTLDKIKQAGSQVKYFSVDITNYEKVKMCLDEVRNEWGEITGFIHGAGVIADKLIVDKTEEQFDMVFKTKVEGLRALLKATEQDNLRVLCLFSSVAGRFGNMGQCDYAMSNEILNKVANLEAKKRGESCIVKAINWGPWEGGMVTPFLKKHMQQMGIPLIPLEEGACAFCDEITYINDGSAEVIIGPSLPEGGFTMFKESEKEYDLLVNKDSFPYLSSHQIKDTVVVPVTIATDWMLRASKAFMPFSNICQINNIKVMKGIQLKDYKTGSNDFVKIKCKSEENHIKVTLNKSDGVVYYSGEVYSGNHNSREIKSIKEFNKQDSKPWPFDVNKAYGEHLFHGKDLQVIKELLDVSENNASASLIGGPGLEWPKEYFIVDPAVLDGGLQVQLLWCYLLKGKYSLPTSIKSLIIYENGLLSGPIHVEIEKISIDNTKSISNIYYFDSTGKLLLEIKESVLTMLLSGSIKG